MRRQLVPVLTGARIADVDARRPDLRIPFPPRFRSRLRGQSSLRYSARQVPLAELSSGESLLMHLGMSGSFRIEAAGAARAPLAVHDHVVFDLESGARVIFDKSSPLRLMDLLTVTERERHPVLSRLGPEPLSAEFDGWALARACRGKKTSLKAALLDQRVVAGSVTSTRARRCTSRDCHREGELAMLATPTGTPRDSAHRLAAAIKQVLERGDRAGVRPAIPLVALPRLRSGGQPCPRRTCGGVVRRDTQAGRSTFYCPVCQR